LAIFSVLTAVQPYAIRVAYLSPLRRNSQPLSARFASAIGHAPALLDIGEAGHAHHDVAGVVVE
jgi:hypothetical protein